MNEHSHVWRVVSHQDNCHSFETSYSCHCGATRSVGGERDITDDPTSVYWLLDRDCPRCDALIAGADPLNWDEVVPV